MRYLRALAFVPALGIAAPLAAQDPAPPVPAGYHYGKWLAAAFAVGFTTLAVRSHNAADRAYNGLLAYCRAGSCAVGPDGHYVDPDAEARYQDVTRGDRDARALFVGAQASLASAVVLFVLEVHRSSREPPNIPYHGLTVTPHLGGVDVGWQLAIP